MEHLIISEGKLQNYLAHLSFCSAATKVSFLLTGPCGCSKRMIEMKRNERVKQCTVIDEMESNYVNVDSL